MPAAASAPPPRHLLELDALDVAQLQHLLEQAAHLKAERRRHAAPLSGCGLAMIFEKPSTRTRVSFEVGIRELGGYPLMLATQDLQLGRGETIADTARVLSRYVDGIMMRANLHETLVELATYASVPVLNGLSDKAHPCQILADLLTIQERLGRLEGLVVTWAGDGNNVLHSWMHAAALCRISLRIAAPEAHYPDPAILARVRQRGAEVTLHPSLAEAARHADIVITDTWVSMGQENSHMRLERLAPYQVTAEVMAQARDHALFLHCLPAHRGMEVTTDVIDGPSSVVWDEAENRLHAQKALLQWALAPHKAA